MTLSPVPRYDLLHIEAYQSIGVQFSRGCPFNGELCDIIEVFGRVPRTKTPEQLLREFDAIYAAGFRGMLFWWMKISSATSERPRRCYRR